MVLTDDQRLEVDLYLKVVEQENPRDILQFSSNYFNKRLEQQRAILNSGGSSTSLSASINNSRSASGINLFKGNFGLDNKDKLDRPISPIDPMHSDLTTSNEGPTASSGHKLQVKENIPMNFNALRRTSVSAETFQPENIENWTPEHFSEKTNEQMIRLKNAVGNNFLFNTLDTDAANLVIGSLEEKRVTTGTEIIKQGEEGDYFYIVEEGQVKYLVNGNEVSSSGPGSTFGELALMYNSPRAATVLAVTPCVLWALDRSTFRKILLGGSFKKRVLYDDFLKSVPILEGLSNYDRGKLADALETEIYEPGSIIIREGDQGENFYVIEYGSCNVSKNNEGIVAQLKPHDYFGEVALLNDLPRQATITTTTKTKVVTLGKAAFERLLGPVRDILVANDPTK